MADSIIDLKNNDCVIAHVEMMQGIINRLADNSAKCKEWCFTLIGALIVFLFSSDNEAKINYQILYYMVGLFFLLDAYYLGLERNLKDHLTDFIEKINNKDGINGIDKDIFIPYGVRHNRSCRCRIFLEQLCFTFCSIFSFSVLIPYGLIIFITWIFSPTA